MDTHVCDDVLFIQMRILFAKSLKVFNSFIVVEVLSFSLIHRHSLSLTDMDRTRPPYKISIQAESLTANTSMCMLLG